MGSGSCIESCANRISGAPLAPCARRITRNSIGILDIYNQT